MLQQFCDDASVTAFISNNGVASDWGWNTFLKHSIIFNKNSITNVTTVFL